MAEDQEEIKEQENITTQKKSNHLVLVIVITVLVFTLIIGIVIVALLLTDNDTPQQINMRQEQMMGNNQLKQPMRLNNSQRVESLEIGLIHEIDSFTINLLSDKGRRYLKITMRLELKNDEVVAELNKKSVVIRDIIIRVLTSKTLEEIATSKGKEKLKDELVSQINLRLQDGEIRNVYFTEFVIQ